MASSLSPALALVPPDLIERVRPLSLAAERCLPVVPELAGLLPVQGLQRGSVVGVDSPAVAFRLIAAATTAGSWAALVLSSAVCATAAPLRSSACWVPGLGAAAELGVALERLALIQVPASERTATERTAAVLGALVDGVDLILLGPGVRVTPLVARRLASRARERGSVLVALGGAGWPERVDLSVQVEGVEWDGLGIGHGHLRRGRVQVTVAGRGGATRPRRGWVHWGEPDEHAGDEPEGSRDEPKYHTHAYGLVS